MWVINRSPHCYIMSVSIHWLQIQGGPGPRQSHPLAIHDRLQRSAGPVGVVTQGGHQCGFPGQPHDGDGRVAQAGPSRRAVAAADLGSVSS